MPCVSTLKEHPIIFSTPMVQAILEDRKTQTRRIIKPQPKNTDFDFRHDPYSFSIKKDLLIKCPYGQPGDLLWVRESCSYFKQLGGSLQREKIKYKADDRWDGNKLIKWKPSIHMPKAAARIWLQVKDVRVERVRDLSNDDAIAEGVESFFSGMFQETRYKDYEDLSNNWRSPYSSFQSLWILINGLKSWDDNQWVWVVEFERVEKPNKNQSP